MVFNKKEYMKEYNKEYNQKLGVKKKRKEYMKGYNKKYYHLPKNKKRKKEYAKEYLKKNKKKLSQQKKEYHQRPKVKKRMRGYLKKYYQKHKEVIKERSKKQRENNREYYLNYCNDYYKKNGQTKDYKEKRTKYHKDYVKTKNGKEIILKNKRKRRLIMRQVIEIFTIKEWEEKVKLTEGICPICGHEFNNNSPTRRLTLDHNPPVSKVSKGFVYTINDVQPICQSCNSSKNNKIIKIGGGYSK